MPSAPDDGLMADELPPDSCRIRWVSAFHWPPLPHPCAAAAARMVAVLAIVADVRGALAPPPSWAVPGGAFSSTSAVVCSPALFPDGKTCSLPAVAGGHFPA